MEVGLNINVGMKESAKVGGMVSRGIVLNGEYWGG